MFCAALGEGIGGLETWVSKLAAYLPSHGWEPLIALGRGSTFNNPDRFKEFHPELPTTEIDGRGWDREGRTREVMRTIQKHQPDIVVPLSMIEATEAVCRLKQTSMPVRLLIRAQGNLPAILADLKRYQSCADMMGCPGRLTKQYALERGGYSEDRVRYIPNGSEAPASKRIEREAGEPIRLGYVGRLTPNDKRALDIIPFVKTMNELGIPFHFDIVGAGPCEEQIRKELQSEVLSRQVKLHGRMSPKDISAKIYSNLDALMLFSASESFGIVLVEAMMHGVVPITSKYVGFETQKLIQDGHNGFAFEVGDVNQAAQWVQKLATIDALRERSSEAGRKMARENFQWDEVLSKWVLLFDEMIAKEPLHCDSWKPVKPSENGFLNRMPIPDSAIHQIRKWKRSIAPPKTTGDEWTFRNTDYSEQELEEIENYCLEQESSKQETELAS